MSKLYLQLNKLSQGLWFYCMTEKSLESDIFRKLKGFGLRTLHNKGWYSTVIYNTITFHQNYAEKDFGRTWSKWIWSNAIRCIAYVIHPRRRRCLHGWHLRTNNFSYADNFHWYDSCLYAWRKRNIIRNWQFFFEEIPVRKKQKLVEAIFNKLFSLSFRIGTKSVPCVDRHLNWITRT
jgi:hypothetical protein